MLQNTMKYTHTSPLPKIKMINILLYLISAFVFKKQGVNGKALLTDVYQDYEKTFQCESTCPVWDGPGGAVEGRREAALRDFDFLPPSAKGLALRAYFQDGGGLGARVPDLPGSSPGKHTAAARTGRGGSR